MKYLTSSYQQWEKQHRGFEHRSHQLSWLFANISNVLQFEISVLQNNPKQYINPLICNKYQGFAFKVPEFQII